MTYHDDIEAIVKGYAYSKVRPVYRRLEKVIEEYNGLLEEHRDTLRRLDDSRADYLRMRELNVRLEHENRLLKLKLQTGKK